MPWCTGCRTDPARQVCCTLRLKGCRLLVAVEDSGEGFDWRAAWNHAAAVPQCSGRGIEILRKYADRVRYNGRGNLVTIVKRFGNGERTMIVVTREENRTMIRPDGNDIVAATVPELRLKMQEMVGAGVRDMVVDLAGIRMVDSSGIGLLISAYNSLRKAGGQFAVIHASRRLWSCFGPMRMHQHFSVSGNCEGNHE